MDCRELASTLPVVAYSSKVAYVGFGEYPYNESPRKPGMVVALRVEATCYEMQIPHRLQKTQQRTGLAKSA